MAEFPEKARPVINAMHERIRPFIIEAMDDCLAARLKQTEALNALLVGLFYQGGFIVAAFEKASGEKYSARDLAGAARAALNHARKSLKEGRADV